MQHSAASVPTEQFCFTEVADFFTLCCFSKVFVKGLFLYCRNQLMWLPNTTINSNSIFMYRMSCIRGHLFYVCMIWMCIYLFICECTVYYPLWCVVVLVNDYAENNTPAQTGIERIKKALFFPLWCNIREFGTVSFIRQQVSVTLRLKNLYIFRASHCISLRTGTISRDATFLTVKIRNQRNECGICMDRTSLQLMFFY